MFGGENKGFTLIEVLAALAVTGILMAGMLTLYMAGLRNWDREMDRAERQQSLRIALDKIAEELQCAQEIINYDALQRGSSEILYRKPGEERTFRFRLEGQEVVFESLRGAKIYSHNKVALGIAELKFYRLDGGNTVKILIGASSRSDVLTLETAVTPRNL